MKWLCISRERRGKVFLRLKVRNKREGKESKVKVGKLEGKFLLKSKRKIKEQKKDNFGLLYFSGREKIWTENQRSRNFLRKKTSEIKKNYIYINYLYPSV